MGGNYLGQFITTNAIYNSTWTIAGIEYSWIINRDKYNGMVYADNCEIIMED